METEVLREGKHCLGQAASGWQSWRKKSLVSLKRAGVERVQELDAQRDREQENGGRGNAGPSDLPKQACLLDEAV